jgi:hypothetical protein
MESWQLFIEILLIHFLADFGLQTHDQATGKGKGWAFINRDLFKHVLTYSLVWFVWLMCHYGFWATVLGTGFIFITHYVTDWITSRLSKPLFETQDFHNGFVIVGADQVAHYITLIWLILMIT